MESEYQGKADESKLEELSRDGSIKYLTESRVGMISRAGVTGSMIVEYCMQKRGTGKDAKATIENAKKEAIRAYLFGKNVNPSDEVPRAEVWAGGPAVK